MMIFEKIFIKLLKNNKLKKKSIKSIEKSEGIIYLTGMNNPYGKPDSNSNNYLPFLYEQANILNTILKNIESL
jgi:hypothetical protein